MQKGKLFFTKCGTMLYMPKKPKHMRFSPEILKSTTARVFMADPALAQLAPFQPPGRYHHCTGHP